MNITMDYRRDYIAALKQGCDPSVLDMSTHYAAVRCNEKSDTGYEVFPLQFTLVAEGR